MKDINILGHNVSVVDKFDKGALFDRIGDVITDFLAEKTGKEIKEKIATIKAYDESEAQSNYNQAVALLAKCDTKPTDTTIIDNYSLRGTKMKFGVIPALYTWEEVYEYDEANKPAKSIDLYPTQQTKAKEAKIINPYRMYNQFMRMYVDYRVEGLILETVMNNMDDKKTYKLSAEQASKLNF